MENLEETAALASLQATSEPATIAVMKSGPEMPPSFSESARLTVNVEVFGCMVAVADVSEKSRAITIEAFANAAQMAGSFMLKPRTVASPRPPAEASTAYSTNSRQPSPSAPPLIIPMLSRMDCFSTSTTCLGMSLNSRFSTNSASLRDISMIASFKKP